MRILIAIPAIDRDCKHFANFYSRVHASLKNIKDEVDFLILTRDEDRQIQECWKEIPRTKILPFENYEIEDRHNLAALVKKRNSALEYAEKEAYDLLWFLDSDTGVLVDTLERLIESIQQGADISVAPYKIREFNRAVVGIVRSDEEDPVAEGIFDPHLIETPEIHFPIALGGLGCTLIERGSFSIRCVIRMITGTIEGQKQSFNAEDIGYYINAYYQGKKVYCLSHYLVDHFD